MPSYNWPINVPTMPVPHGEPNPCRVVSSFVIASAIRSTTSLIPSALRLSPAGETLKPAIAGLPGDLCERVVDRLGVPAHRPHALVVHPFQVRGEFGGV